MNKVLISKIKTMLLVFAWTVSIGLLHIAAYVMIDNYSSLGAHYGQLFIFLLFINILSVLTVIFYRRHFMFAFLISTVFCTYCFWAFCEDRPLASYLLIATIEHNNSLLNNCREIALQSTTGVATCLEEDGIIEWKRALIYVHDAETYPTGMLFNNKKIDVLYNKINLIRGNDSIDEMKKGTAYEVGRVSKKFLLISYVLYSM